MGWVKLGPAGGNWGELVGMRELGELQISAKNKKKTKKQKNKKKQKTTKMQLNSITKFERDSEDV